MKHEESEILKGLGKNPGFKVPENYFEEFNKRMLESLPEIEIKEKVDVKPSMWVRVRPYLYAAASIAGIWCMMHVFNIVNGTSANQIGDIAAKIQTGDNADEMMMSGGASEYDIMTYQDSVMNDIDASDNRLKPVSNKD